MTRHSTTDISQAAQGIPTAERRSARIALAALLCGAAAIAFAPIFVRLSEIGPSATAFWRLAFALPVFWLWLTCEPRDNSRFRKPSSLKDYRRLMTAGLFFAGDLAVWHWSIRFTTVANATLFANFAPIFVTLGAWLLFSQGVSKTFLLGLATAIVGATTLMSTSLRLSSQNLFGDGLGILTAVFYAAYILSIKELRKDFSTSTIMAWAGLACCMALLPISLLSGESLFAVTVYGWLVLLGLALVSQVSGQGLIAFALAYLPAAFSSVTLLLQPVLAAVFAWILLKEFLGPWQVFGGSVVLCGIFLARLGSRLY